MFEYGSLPALRVADASVTEGAGCDAGELSDRLTESSEKGVQAWLVVPLRSVPVPFAVLLHGGGQDQRACVPEAALLADVGIASLLIDLPQAREMPDFFHPETYTAAFAETVITVRRGLGHLALRSDIDIARGAVVGFSFGATVGTAVAATDKRVSSAILVACVPRMSEFWRAGAHPELAEIRGRVTDPVMQRYAEATKVLDAAESLQQSVAPRLLFQFGCDDELVPESCQSEFAPYLSGNNQAKRYESTSHYGMFLNPDAREDRLCWLRSQFEV